MSDAPTIYALMVGERHMGEKFYIDTLKYVKENIKTTWVFSDMSGQIVAYMLCHIPGKEKDNMAQDIGLPKSEWGKVAYLDSVVVAPAYRGNRIMQSLLQHAMDQLAPKGYCHFFATVHPDNPASKRSLEAVGLEEYDRHDKYNGLIRCCMYKHYEP